MSFPLIIAFEVALALDQSKQLCFVLLHYGQVLLAQKLINFCEKDTKKPQYCADVLCVGAHICAHNTFPSRAGGFGAVAGGLFTPLGVPGQQRLFPHHGGPRPARQLGLADGKVPQKE